MTVVATNELAERIESASSDVGLLWPIDRAVAVNPLLDVISEDFSVATARLGARLGADPWPTNQHLDESTRRGLVVDSTSPSSTTSEGAVQRPPTLYERASTTTTRKAAGARSMVGQVLLETATAKDADVAGVLDRARDVLMSSASWVRAPRQVRHAAATLIGAGDLGALLGRLAGWSDAEIDEEMARHFARLPGWSAWAKWYDLWDRDGHRAGVTRAELLIISLAVDFAWLDNDGATTAPPTVLEGAGSVGGLERLERLEQAVHADMLDRLSTHVPSSGSAPRFQVVTCIDVRSEPLRRALEASAEVETFGFAGFFGVLASVAPSSDREAYESLPVLVPPAATIVGGPTTSATSDELVAAGGTLAKLTHEPTAMFALAETTGFLGSPVLLARTLLPRVRLTDSEVPGAWHLEAEGHADIAEGALRGMGMTETFAPEVVFLGHGSTTANNPHFATLDCGACAGHQGGPNAAILAGILNDPSVRDVLAERGITIPASTTFLSGVHDTTREVVTVEGQPSKDLAATLQAATDTVAIWRASPRVASAASARRRLDRRSRDWAEVRPEWGLADHAAFVVAPRSSLRGVDLEGRSFLHSYDPAADGDGAILQSILAAPVVVAQWINASYYFSTVAPEVLGAGDKTLLNPVGDFAVVQGDDPDLRLGLPWQSVASGDRPMHQPVRLLVAVEAPLERTADALRGAEMPRQLVEGGWIHLVGRSGPGEPWIRWEPGHGWATA